MPAHFNGKRKKGTQRTARAKRSRTTKFRRAKRSNLPRKTLRTSPGSQPNQYNFTRSHSQPFNIGLADNDNGVYLNTPAVGGGGQYMVIKLNQKGDMLTKFSEFETLFSEFKITSFKQTLTPYYKDNLQFSENGTSTSIAIPNYEVIEIPVSSSINQPEFETMTAAEIQAFLDQSQRKGKRLMPSAVQSYWTTKPKVSILAASSDKESSVYVTKMTTPSWLPTTQTSTPAGAALGSAVRHYGKQLLVRRVDGKTLNSHGSGDSGLASMGFRMDSQVFLKMRKVQ